MKGQIFMLIAVITVLALILLRSEVGVYKTIEQTSYQTFSTITENYENIKAEYQKAAQIALFTNRSQNVMESLLNNFTNFTYNAYNQRNYTLNTIYALTFINSTNVSITVGNGLGKNITNFTVGQSLSKLTSTNLTLADKTSNTSVFTTSSLGQFTVNVTYFLGGTKYNFSYGTDTNKTAALYVDVYLQEDNSYLNDKLILNLTSS